MGEKKLVRLRGDLVLSQTASLWVWSIVLLHARAPEIESFYHYADAGSARVDGRRWGERLGIEIVQEIG